MLPPTPTVMAVDADSALAGTLASIAARRGYSPLVVGDPDEAVRRFIERPPSAVVLDVTDGGRGLDALARFRKLDREVPVLVVSGPGEPGTMVQLMRGGAADLLCKPVEEERLDAALGCVLAERAVSAELAALRRALEAEPQYRLVAGESGPMTAVSRLVERLADSDVPVLLAGEPGTGKQRVARAIHDASSRRGKPFVKVSCLAEPAGLLEASLFGAERGTANGGAQHRPGKLEFASHGSIFFDEVAALGPALQARLLQVLAERRFYRGGGRTVVATEARFVTATSRDLQQEVADGRFLEELRLRLGVFEIALPPLRERPDDIEHLTDHFLARFSVTYNTPPPRLSDETRRVFREHAWPGNVRELEDAVRRLVVLGGETQVRRELLRACGQGPAPALRRPAVAPEAAPASPLAPPPASAPPPGSLKDIARAAAREAERAAISRMLQRTRWNRKEAAEILGISYKALLYKIKENGLDKPPTS